MTVNPRTEFHHFPHNTRLYAEYWLKTGTRLDGWASRVDPELREELLAELEGVAG
jgi:hypothetical protein